MTNAELDQKAGDKLTEAEYEAVIDHGYQLGQVTGIELVLGMLLTKACDYYRANKDSEADMLRDVSKELRKLADEKRKDYENTYPH